MPANGRTASGFRTALLGTRSAIALCAGHAERWFQIKFASLDREASDFQETFAWPYCVVFQRIVMNSRARVPVPMR